MTKHVTFNPNVQYQLCDINKTSVDAKNKVIIPISDKESNLRNRRSTRNINTVILPTIIKLQSSNFILSQQNKTTTNKVKQESMDIDVISGIEYMDID